MTTITVEVKNKKQASKIKAALRLVDAKFYENEKEVYNPDFVKKILDAEKGNFTRVKKEELNSFIDSL